MTWFFFMLLTVFFDSAILLVQKKWTTRKSHNSLVSGALYQIVVGIMIALFAILSGNLDMRLTITGLLLVVFSIILFTISASLWYYAIERISASTTTIVLSTRSIFALTLGFILLGETITFRQIGGTVLILMGVIYSQYSHRLTANIHHIAILVLNAFVASSANIIDRLATKTMNLYTYLILAFIFPGLIMLLIQKIKHKKVQLRLTKPYMFHILIVSTLIFFGSIFYLFGLSKAPSTGLAVIVNQTKVVLTVILAAMFLHERGHIRQKVISSVMCLGGLYLLN